MPLVYESFNWSHGVFCGARMASETTAAATSHVGVVRRDPMAMLPFCGYNMGDYFRNWLDIGKKLKHPPKIYSVNWFRADENGRFIWPGFGENIRVLKWILERVNNQVEAQKTPIGLIPRLQDLDLSGLDIPARQLDKLFEVNPEEWQEELRDIEKFLSQFSGRLPKEILQEYQALKEQLNNNGAAEDMDDSIRFTDRGGA